MSEAWPWLMIAGLGFFHGINPAMGWLFAVALGLQRGERNIVFVSLIPLALGHAVAIAGIVILVMLAGTVLRPTWIVPISGIFLIGWAAYHAIYGHRHRVRVGMKAGFTGLFFWSAFMATAHGAGLMLIPALMPLGLVAGASPVPAGTGNSVSLAIAAVGLHTTCMLAMTGFVAWIVYEWMGLAFLRRGWVNMDILWTAALVVTGIILLTA